DPAGGKTEISRKFHRSRDNRAAASASCRFPSADFLDDRGGGAGGDGISLPEESPPAFVFVFLSFRANIAQPCFRNLKAHLLILTRNCARNQGLGGPRARSYPTANS